MPKDLNPAAVPGYLARQPILDRRARAHGRNSSSVAFRPEVRGALAGQARPERALLSWIEHIEENDVPGREAIAEAFTLDRDKHVETYWRALGEQQMRID